MISTSVRASCSVIRASSTTVTCPSWRALRPAPVTVAPSAVRCGSRVLPMLPNPQIVTCAPRSVENTPGLGSGCSPPMSVAHSWSSWARKARCSRRAAARVRVSACSATGRSCRPRPLAIGMSGSNPARIGVVAARGHQLHQAQPAQPAGGVGQHRVRVAPDHQHVGVQLLLRQRHRRVVGLVPGAVRRGVRHRDGRGQQHGQRHGGHSAQPGRGRDRCGARVVAGQPASTLTEPGSAASCAACRRSRSSGSGRLRVTVAAATAVSGTNG